MPKDYEAARRAELARDAAFLPTAEAVAGHLGSDWTLEPRKHETDLCATNGTLKHKDGVAISFYLDRYRNRLKCSPAVPQDENGTLMSLANWGVIERGQSLEATFAVDRDPGAIAKDIGRKIFEPYKPMHETIQVALAERRAKKCKAEALADEILATIAGRGHPVDAIMTGQTATIWKGDAEFQVSPYGHVSARFRSLTRDDALALAKWVRDNLNQH